MADETTAAEPASNGEAKPKAPRREGTRLAAATKIAETHPNPAALLTLLDEKRADMALEAEEKDIAAREAALSTERATHRASVRFVEETTGLGAFALAGIRAGLTSRLVKPADTVTLN